MICKNCLSHNCTCRNSFISDDTESIGYSVSSIDSGVSGVSCVSSDNNSPDTIPKQFICNNCNIIFKNKQTLNLHKKTINCKNNVNQKNIDKTICEYCQKIFSSKQMKNYHQNNCIEKIKQELTDIHKAEIEKIKNEYEELIESLQMK